MTVFFWTSLAIICYTFIGYGLILWLLLKVKSLFFRLKSKNTELTYTPRCSVLIAAFNEESFIREKILNTLALDYPSGRLEIFIVADGSTDNTVEIIKEYPEINLLFRSSRMGKVNAIDRAMKFIKSDIVVFTDANTYLNKEALIKICSHFSDPKVGGVAGEKRIYTGSIADASSAGESLYWKYESTLKKWDSDLNTAIGAAGELFSIRRRLFEPVPESTILDDFMISMNIVQKGFKIMYEPEAYAMETASASAKEELKRKVRIAAGGIQSIIRLRNLLYFWETPLLSFQYISHRVLRWSITPFLLIIVLILNTVLAITEPLLTYKFLFLAQISFYSLAILGFCMAKKEIKVKITFIPYYFCLMNFAVTAGIVRYFKGNQSAVWEKSKRKTTSQNRNLELVQEKFDQY